MSWLIVSIRVRELLVSWRVSQGSLWRRYVPVRRDDPFINDAAEFHGSSRPCCNVDGPVSPVIVSREIGSRML
jgi:hypothetical protein